MRIAFFSSKQYDVEFFGAANTGYRHEITYLEPRLTVETAVLARGYPVVCAFVNDQLDADVLAALHSGGTQMLALRSAGFNHVDRSTARRLGLVVAHVPAYSPHAVAEHTIGLMLTLNRKTHLAYTRVRAGNFSLDGLLGFDMHKRTVGVVGTGKIGMLVVRILRAFGCEVLAHDPYPNDECTALGASYVSLQQLLSDSDIVTLHCPLTPETEHLIDDEAVAAMRDGVMLINTGRGSLIDTRAVIAGLKTGHIGHLGLDVYEEEEGLFFEDLSDQVIRDDVLSRLLTFPNVVVTGHQGFFTREAMESIADTTLANIAAWGGGSADLHLVPDQE